MSQAEAKCSGSGNSNVLKSKSFDMLEDDFSYSLLVTTIMGLLIATFVTFSMVQRDNVKRNWV